MNDPNCTPHDTFTLNNFYSSYSEQRLKVSNASNTIITLPYYKFQIACLHYLLYYANDAARNLWQLHNYRQTIKGSPFPIRYNNSSCHPKNAKTYSTDWTEPWWPPRKILLVCPKKAFNGNKTLGPSFKVFQDAPFLFLYFFHYILTTFFLFFLFFLFRCHCLKALAQLAFWVTIRYWR